MGAGNEVLQRAISEVEEECAYLQKERRAFEGFREQVSLTTADSTDETSPSATTNEILVAYRESVMDALDYETVYSDTIAESLQEELSLAIARMVCSNEPLTQRRKRKLLVATSAAIERREEFIEELDNEREALRNFVKELEVIDDALKDLPTCSPSELHIEDLLVVWEVSETMLERCEQLIERRQAQLREAERNAGTFGEKHARNEYLYSKLDSRYPVLSDIAATCGQITAKRNGKRYIEMSDLMLQ